jgi:hypothetical protein
MRLACRSGDELEISSVKVIPRTLFLSEPNKRVGGRSIYGGNPAVITLEGVEEWVFQAASYFSTLRHSAAMSQDG